MITTDIIEAHLACAVLPRPELRAKTSGTSKAMTAEDKAAGDDQQTSTKKSRLPSLVAATTGEHDGRLSLPVYLEHLETQQNTIERFRGTHVKDTLGVVKENPKEHSTTIPPPCRKMM